MGKKYIVEVGRLERLYKAYVNGNGKPNITWLSPEVDLTPYTEPDLEQVRKEAYKQGYDDAKCGYENGFENGMIVAWEAARKICSSDRMTSDMRKAIFGWSLSEIVMDKFTASEAIGKLKAYEQKEIKAGDEVFYVGCPDIKLWVIGAYNNKLEGIALGDVNGCCEIGDLFKEEPLKNYAKTGNHYEIATVLEKMRGEQDG